MDSRNRNESLATCTTPRPWMIFGAQKMRICAGLAVLVGAFAARANGQEQLDWMTTHAGPLSGSSEFVSRATVDATGNVYLGVTSFVAPDTHIEIVKLSPSGSLLWMKRIAGSSVGDMALAPNGDLCVSGSDSALLTRLAPDGLLLWSASLPGARANALAFDTQGAAIVAGSAGDDMLVQAYSPAGALLWDTRIDGPDQRPDEAACLLVDPAGDLFVAGAVGTALGYTDAAVAKLDSAGQLSWLSTWSATVNSESFNAIASDGQGGVIVGGRLQFDWFPQGTFTNAHIARCSASGAYLWHFPTTGAAVYDAVIDLLVDRSGVAWVLIQDEIYSFSKPSIVVRRLAMNGALLSTLQYDGPTHSGAVPGGLLLGSAGQVFVSGSLGDNFGSVAAQAVLMQLDGSADVTWTQLYSGAGYGCLANSGLCAGPQARLVAFGSALFANFSTDALALQVDVGDSPQGYCRPKVNSLGCTPRMLFTGISKAASSSGFVVRAEQIANNKSGLFLYGLQGGASTPFGGGQLCVASPQLRTPALNSGGMPNPAQDCSGVFALDMNAFASGQLGGTPAPGLSIPGTTVRVQAWGRDPGFPAPDNVTLSSGLRYVVLP